LGAANTWTLITLPNLPVFPSTGFGLDPGYPPNTGYWLAIQLAEGAGRITSANDVWVSQAAGLNGAIGISNFSASPVNSTFDLAFCQHEPGPQCTTLIDCPFSGPNGNLEACQRYYQKTYSYPTLPKTVTSNGEIILFNVFPTTITIPCGPISFKKTMATPPTVTMYNPATGAVNSVRQFAATTDYTVSSVNDIGDGGFDYITLATALVANAAVYGHYTADTGW
jgi:hypothetical protein